MSKVHASAKPQGQGAPETKAPTAEQSAVDAKLLVVSVFHPITEAEEEEEPEVETPHSDCDVCGTLVRDHTEPEDG